MAEQQKTLKQYAKEAKKRLKNGFWQKYYKELEDEVEKAKKAGVSESKVKEYYKDKVSFDIKTKKNSEEDFYRKFKKILDEEGEIPGVLGRLTDKKEYESLSYEEKQTYSLKLSERYLKAVERYNKEKAFSISDNHS